MEREEEEEENANSYRHFAVEPTRGQEVKQVLNGLEKLLSCLERDGGALR